jgi:hypothetical protein
MLAGCDRHGDVSGPGRHGGGKYQGIGIYPADPLWQNLIANEANKDLARALRADDGQIIVVVDTQTGEVRQCGNLSGYCVTMHPWSGALGADRAAPVRLSKHAAELANETTPEPAKASVKQP